MTSIQIKKKYIYIPPDFTYNRIFFQQMLNPHILPIFLRSSFLPSTLHIKSSHLLPKIMHCIKLNPIQLKSIPSFLLNPYSNHSFSKPFSLNRTKMAALKAVHVSDVPNLDQVNENAAVSLSSRYNPKGKFKII